MEKIIKNPTFFVDIDDTIVKYRKFNELSTSILTPIQEVIDYLNLQFDNGAIIIVTTARPKQYELFTKQELEKIGLKYHQLVLDCGRGTRVIFNDKDPENPNIDRAIGINFTRDMGFSNMDNIPKIDSYEL